MANHHAIGLVELNSIAKGIEASDILAKTADVTILVAKTICPGKYIVLIGGGVANVKQSMDAALRLTPETIVDHFIIPNIHPSILPAIGGAKAIEKVEAVGVIETYSVAATIEATDVAVKTAQVEPIRMHLAFGIGGKSYVILTGDISSINTAVEVGSAVAGERGFLVQRIVIARPDKQVISTLL